MLRSASGVEVRNYLDMGNRTEGLSISPRCSNHDDDFTFTFTSVSDTTSTFVYRDITLVIPNPPPPTFLPSYVLLMLDVACLNDLKVFTEDVLLIVR
jgi:hypothetical protein